MKKNKTNLLPLTIVTAVLNEEANLPSFLDHVTKIAQEVIVVVDYRTKDKSADIARQYGCKVLQDKGESQGIVFNNKNWGINEAAHEWVFIMDADERMDNVLQAEIKKIVTSKAESSVVMYQTGFINYEFGKFFTQCDQKNKKFIRLFKKGFFSYSTNKTAEGFHIHTHSLSAKQSKLTDLGLRIPLVRSWIVSRNPAIRNLKGLLIHNSHPTISDFIRKIDLYSSREAKIFVKNNRSLSSAASIRNIILWPMQEFLYKYFAWRFYTEGIHGFIASVLYAYYHFLIAAKIYATLFKNSQNYTQLGEEYSFVNQKKEE